MQTSRNSKGSSPRRSSRIPLPERTSAASISIRARALRLENPSAGNSFEGASAAASFSAKSSIRVFSAASGGRYRAPPDLLNELSRQDFKVLGADFLGKFHLACTRARTTPSRCTSGFEGLGCQTYV